MMWAGGNPLSPGSPMPCAEKEIEKSDFKHIKPTVLDWIPNKKFESKSARLTATMLYKVKVRAYYWGYSPNDLPRDLEIVCLLKRRTFGEIMSQ